MNKEFDITDIELRFTGAITTFRDLEEFTDGWLNNRRLSDETRTAYRRDVFGYLRWCDANDLDPMKVIFVHVNRYAREREADVSGSTIDRALSAIKMWYRFLVQIGAVAANPVDSADRYSTGQDSSPRRCLTFEEVDQLLAAAQRPWQRAAIGFLYGLGMRVTEVCNLDVEDMKISRGRIVVDFVGKGGKRRRRPVPEDIYVEAIATAGGRTSGPLFITQTGARRDRHMMLRMLQTVAALAGISEPWTVVPHALRKTHTIHAKRLGVPLEDRQDALGHADPRTTRRYDREDDNLDNDPAHALAAARERRLRHAEEKS